MQTKMADRIYGNYILKIIYVQTKLIFLIEL